MKISKWYTAMVVFASLIWCYMIIGSIWGNVSVQGYSVEHPLAKMVTSFFILIFISIIFMILGFVGKLALFPWYSIILLIFHRDKYVQLKNFGLRMFLAVGLWIAFGAVTALLIGADAVAEKFNGDRWYVFLNNTAIASGPVALTLFFTGYIGKFLFSPFRYVYLKLREN